MEKEIMSVSELTFAISSLLKDAIGSVRIQGEISNFKTHTSGHRYFTLKDSGSQIACTMWKSRPLSFEPKDGMKVVVRGAVTVYPPRGSYQIECTSITPLGTGDLFMAFEALKEKLGEKGYFEYERKRPIPQIPLNIGISTSPTGAAVQDMFTTINRRLPACKIYFRPTLVQGEGSAEDIVKAIEELQKTPAEVIIIGRGGGSIEDLWSYNTELVADAVYKSKVPVISAVGHETDYTIADFVADLRAATPTAAAELVTSKTSAELIEFFTSTAQYLNKLIMENIEDRRDNIQSLIESYSFRRVADTIKSNMQRLDENEIRMEQSIKRALSLLRNRVTSIESHCKSLNPVSPLKKGFSLLRCNGTLIENNQSLDSFNEIEIERFSEHAKANIIEVKNKQD